MTKNTPETSKDPMKRPSNAAYLVPLALLAQLFGPQTLAVASTEPTHESAQTAEVQLIVELETPLLDERIAQIFQSAQALEYEQIGPEGSSTFLVTPNPRNSLDSNIALLELAPGVEFAELNHKLQIQETPNDDQYLDGNQWGLYSTDSTPSSSFGSAAQGAWASGFTGSKDVFVAVIDTGIDISHPDLAANIWVNDGEVPQDGIDNDRNGFVDDVNGYDFVNNDGSVFDSAENLHGTHIAGTIGAVGGNGIGVAGINWQVGLISLKIANAGGSASSDDAIAAIDYAVALKKAKGLNIAAINFSLAGPSASQALENAIGRAGDAGIAFVAASGNGERVFNFNESRWIYEGVNLDTKPQYPAASTCTTSIADFDCIVSVAALTQAGNLATFSNYSATKVDLAAPGTGILSTTPNGQYAYLTGTSMATPHVTGAIALCISANPLITAPLAVSKLYESVSTMSSLTGKVASGGRLNVASYVASCASHLPTSTLSAFTLSPEPTISGSGLVGNQLEAVPGDWDQDTTLSYQWLRNGNWVWAASSSSYTIRANDVGKHISLMTTATKPDFTKVSRTSSSVSPNWSATTSLISISGKAEVGETLTARASELLAFSAITYQWLRGEDPITTATGASYLQTVSDSGTVISVEVQGLDILTAPSSSIRATAFTTGPEVVLPPPIEPVTPSAPQPSSGGGYIPPVSNIGAPVGTPSSSPSMSPSISEPAASANEPMPKYLQRTLGSFIKGSASLGAAQRSAIAALAEANPAKFICTGIRLGTNTVKENIFIRQRAKAACDYAKSLRPEISTWYQSKATKLKSFSGRVLLGLRG